MKCLCQGKNTLLCTTYFAFHRMNRSHLFALTKKYQNKMTLDEETQTIVC